MNRYNINAVYNYLFYKKKHSLNKYLNGYIVTVAFKSKTVIYTYISFRSTAVIDRGRWSGGHTLRNKRYPVKCYRHVNQRHDHLNKLSGF